MAGMQFDITDNWFSDVGYRYINTGELKVGRFFRTGVELHADDVTRHDLMLGFGYRF